MTQANYSYVQQRFDHHAARYGHNLLTHWIGNSEMAALQTLIPPAQQPGSTPALDFGCGGGRSASLLLDADYRVTGYDISANMLSRAAATLGDNPLVTLTSDPASIARPWPLILSLGILDYYPDTSPIWQKWSQLLAPEGSLVVTVPNARNPLARLYTFSSRLTCQSYTSTLETLTLAARTAGLVVTEVRYAFPGQVWGHTIVLRLRHADDII